MEILIGKGPESNYRVDHEVVSRAHCKLIHQQNSLFIMDLGSTNGTYVNRQRIPPQTMVPISPDTEVLLSGQIPLDWSLLRQIMPGIADYRTKFVPEAEINRMLNSRPASGPIVQPAAPPQQHRPYQAPPAPQQQIHYQAPAPPPAQAQPVIIAQQSGGPHAGDLVYAVHAGKSYTGKAFITLVLYYLGFYIGGLIANLLFLSEAGQSKKVLGHSPSGYGCLMFLFVTHVIFPILLVFGLIVSGIEIADFFQDIIHDVF